MTLAAAIVQLAAELPDPGQPAFPNICGTFGGFVGMAIGIARRLAWEQTTRLAGQGGAVGYGVGLAIWLVAVAIDRL